MDNTTAARANDFIGSNLPTSSSTTCALQPFVVDSKASSAMIVVPDRLLSSFEWHEGEPFLDHKSYLYGEPLPTGMDVHAAAGRLLSRLQEMKIKKVSLLGIGAGGNIIQAAANLGSRIVRRVIFVDPTTRVAPTALGTWIDRIERFLPLGLPMRSNSDEFDSRSFLHRIRCPTLILNQPNASHFVREQSELIAHSIPNAWRVDLHEAVNPASPSTEFLNLVNQFADVPPKRPQKNVG